MACEYCDQKGYIEIQMMRDNSTKGLVRPCPKCNDTKAYYRHIKEKYGTKKIKPSNTECEVVSLQDRRNRNGKKDLRY